MTHFIVYCHTNRVNAKRYVGLTSFTVEKRWAEHCKAALSGSQTAFHRAIRKHGFDSWKHEILETIETIDQAKASERSWIERLHTHASLGVGYNETFGGDGLFGFQHSEDTRSKLSLLNNGKNNPRFGKLGPNLGKTFSDETRSKMRNSHLGKKRSLESRQKQSRTQTGKFHTRERIENIRRAKTKYHVEQYALDGTLLKVFESFRDVCEELGITSRTSVMNCCHGRTSQAYGFKWKLRNTSV